MMRLASGIPAPDAWARRYGSACWRRWSRHRRDPGLADNLGAEVRRCDAAPRAQRPRSHRRGWVGQRQLADVVHQSGVLQVAQVGVAHAQLATNRHRELADPLRVPGLGVTPHLGDPRKRADGLQVRRSDRRVATERELGEQQRQTNTGSAQEPMMLAARASRTPVAPIAEPIPAWARISSRRTAWNGARSALPAPPPRAQRRRPVKMTTPTMMKASGASSSVFTSASRPDPGRSPPPHRC